MNHIKHTNSVGYLGISYCGAPLDNAFYFKDVEQVLINNQHSTRIVCGDCLRKVIALLVMTPPHIALPNTAQSSTVEN